MKAIVQEGYGSADTLKLRDIETLAPGDNGVFVEVHPASVNAINRPATEQIRGVRG